MADSGSCLPDSAALAGTLVFDFDELPAVAGGLLLEPVDSNVSVANAENFTPTVAAPRDRLLHRFRRRWRSGGRLDEA